MLLRVLSNGLQLRLSETIVRVVSARWCLRRAHKGPALMQKCSGSHAKSTESPPAGFLSDKSGTCKRHAATPRKSRNEGSASGMETLGSQSKIGSAARLELPRNQGCA